MGPRSPFESRQTHSILVLGLYFASCLCVYGAHQRLPWGTPRVGSWEQILVNGFRGGSGFRILFAAFIEPLAPIALTTSSMSKRQGIFEMNWSRLKPRAQNKKPQHDTTLYTSVGVAANVLTNMSRRKPASTMRICNHCTDQCGVDGSLA